MPEATTLVDRLDGLLTPIEKVATVLAAAAMLIVMLVVFVDVGLRYGLNSPLAWRYDLVTLYLLSALSFLALATSWRDSRHIRIDLLHRVLTDRRRAAFDLLAALLALVLTFGFAWEGVLITHEAYAAGRVTPGVYGWPT